MGNKFHCNAESPLRVLLVDDVLTTGTTADSCAKTLKDTGLKWVGVITLTTPRLIKDEVEM